jgi:hypothetical protein
MLFAGASPYNNSGSETEGPRWAWFLQVVFPQSESHLITRAAEGLEKMKIRPASRGFTTPACRLPFSLEVP